MAVLLDSHFVLELLDSDRATHPDWGDQGVAVSVASLWELAIKVRQGKLDPGIPVTDIEQGLLELGCSLLAVNAAHAVAEVDPWPDTNDPFDRLLLAVCQVENLRLVTRDRKLAGHPLAWKPAAG